MMLGCRNTITGVRLNAPAAEATSAVRMEVGFPARRWAPERLLLPMNSSRVRARLITMEVGDPCNPTPRLRLTYLYHRLQRRHELYR